MRHGGHDHASGFGGLETLKRVGEPRDHRLRDARHCGEVPADPDLAAGGKDVPRAEELALERGCPRVEVAVEVGSGKADPSLVSSGGDVAHLTEVAAEDDQVLVYGAGLHVAAGFEAPEDVAGVVGEVERM